MGPMECFRILCLTLTLSAQLAVSFPGTVMPQGHNLDSDGCKMCPAGEYRKSCTECVACPAGQFTIGLNKEDSCRFCSRDCRPSFHLKVIQNCTNKSDVKCVCEEGYTCTLNVPFSDNCRYCKKLQETTTAGEREHTPPAISTGHKTTTVNPCSFHMCGSKPGLVAHTGTHSQTEKMNSLLLPILACLFGGACIAVLVLVYIRRHRNETCFKKAMALLMCNKGERKASHKSKESTHHFPRDSFSAKQQLPPLSSANLGPVHVHNPGTIIFSLLSQFTGQVGPTIEGGKKAETETETGDERGCPVFQPAPSPSIHTSEEERSQETDCIFFPFQEHGKDCHVSKEEVL